MQCHSHPWFLHFPDLELLVIGSWSFFLNLSGHKPYIKKVRAIECHQWDVLTIMGGSSLGLLTLKYSPRTHHPSYRWIFITELGFVIQRIKCYSAVTYELLNDIITMIREWELQLMGFLTWNEKIGFSKQTKALEAFFCGLLSAWLSFQQNKYTMLNFVMQTA